MDDLEYRIIQELQDHFPLELNPYDILAERIGISAEALWQRVLDLIDRGVIRRIGFSIDSRKIGFSSTLSAIRVSPERIERACEIIEGCPQITHSYLRDGEFNIWFTIIAQDHQQIAAILDRIRQELSLSDDEVMNLPVEKLFKLDARFK